VTKDELWKQWDAQGRHAARAHIESDQSSAESRDWAREWLYRHADVEQAAQNDQQRELSFRSLRASEQSSEAAQLSARASHAAAQASERSATVARRSAFWTMIAALASLLGVLVNAALGLGWLDWAKHIAR
jgi:hypothetical protein